MLIYPFSRKLGFWDKILLMLHGSVVIDFEGRGDVHLYLKGGRDPYDIIGTAAGFVICWRRNVKFLLGLKNADNEFFQIESDENIVAIPDLAEYSDRAAVGLVQRDDESGDERPDSPKAERDLSMRRREEVDFPKVVAKLANGVRWGMGMTFERTCRDDTCTHCTHHLLFHRKCRWFHFKPHYEVVTKPNNNPVRRLMRATRRWQGSCQSL